MKTKGLIPVIFDGITYRSVREAARCLGISEPTLRRKLKKSDDTETAVNNPKSLDDRGVILDYFGKRFYSLAEMARHFDLSERVLRTRYERGDRGKRLVRPSDGMQRRRIKKNGRFTYKHVE